MYKLQTGVVARGALTLNEFGMLRKLTPRAAEYWLKTHKVGELTEEEKADVLAAVGDAYLNYHHEYLDHQFPQRPLFFAAAWTAGASWGQLAQMFNIARQTAMRSVERILPTPRVPQDKRITHGQLSAMREAFISYYRADPEGLARLTPHELAQLLLTTPYEDTVGDPYGEDIGIPITTAEPSN